MARETAPRGSLTSGFAPTEFRGEQTRLVSLRPACRSCVAVRLPGFCALPGSLIAAGLALAWQLQPGEHRVPSPALFPPRARVACVQVARSGRKRSSALSTPLAAFPGSFRSSSRLSNDVTPGLPVLHVEQRIREGGSRALCAQKFVPSSPPVIGRACKSPEEQQSPEQSLDGPDVFQV